MGEGDTVTVKVSGNGIGETEKVDASLAEEKQMSTEEVVLGKGKEQFVSAEKKAVPEAVDEVPIQALKDGENGKIVDKIKEETAQVCLLKEENDKEGKMKLVKQELALQSADKGNENPKVSANVRRPKKRVGQKQSGGKAKAQKSVERLVATVEPQPIKKFLVEKGHGTALKEIPNVANQLKQQKADETFRQLHSVLFGRNMKAFKSKVSEFSGFHGHENEEMYRYKIKEKLDKCVVKKLLKFCDVLDIHVATQTNKGDLVSELLNFLAVPHVTTNVVPAEDRQLSEAIKHMQRSNSIVSASSGSTTTTRSARRSKIQGTVIGGIKCKGGIVLGADTRATANGKITEPKGKPGQEEVVDKIFFLKDNIAVVVGTGRVYYIKKVIKAVNEEITECPLPNEKKSASTNIARLLKKHMNIQQKNWIYDDPDFECTLILGMYDYPANGVPKPVLMKFDISSGKNAKARPDNHNNFLYDGCYTPPTPSYLEEKYHDGLSLEDGISIMDTFISLATSQAESNVHGTENDAAIGGHARICIIQPRGEGRTISFRKSAIMIEDCFDDERGYRIKLDLGRIKPLNQPPKSFSRNVDMRAIMKIDLSAKPSKSVHKGDSGSYFSWSPTDLPMLKESNICASKIFLQKNGLAMPCISTSAKVAYVLKGCGIAGITLPKAEKEKLLPIRKGDAIALPVGVVTRWLNKDDVDLVILFVGDASKGHEAGSFTNFPLTGAKDIVSDFETGWDMRNDSEVQYHGKQNDTEIIMVKEDFDMCELSEADTDNIVLCLNCFQDGHVNGGDRVLVVNTTNLPLVRQTGLAAVHISINANSTFSLGVSCDGAYQATYVVRGNGSAQIVGVNGKRMLEMRVTAGDLFVVPRFFLCSMIADGEGLDLFSIITTPNPIFSRLAGSTSVWQLSPEAEENFRCKRTKEDMFFPAI